MSALGQKRTHAVQQRVRANSGHRINHHGRARAAGSLLTKHVIFVFLIMRLWFDSHFSGSRLAALQSRLRCVTKVKDGFG